MAFAMLSDANQPFRIPCMSVAVPETTTDTADAWLMRPALQRSLVVLDTWLIPMASTVNFIAVVIPALSLPSNAKQGRGAFSEWPSLQLLGVSLV